MVQYDESEKVELLKKEKEQLRDAFGRLKDMYRGEAKRKDDLRKTLYLCALKTAVIAERVGKSPIRLVETDIFDTSIIKDVYATIGTNLELVERAVTEISTAHKELQEKLEVYVTKSERSEHDIENLLEASLDMSNKCGEYFNLTRRQEQEIERLQKEYSKREDEFKERIGKLVRSVNITLEEREKKLEELAKTANNVLSQIEDLEVEKKEVEKSIRGYKSHNTRLKNKVERLQEKIRSLETQEVTPKRKEKVPKGNVEKLRKENKKLRDKLEEHFIDYE